MKGDVGMSHHEKEGNKKMPIPTQEIIDNPIPTSLFPINYLYTFTSVPMCPQIAPPVPIYAQQNSCIVHKQRCRDGVINDLLCRYRHLLVPLFFMMRHPYIPLHFREMIFPLVCIGLIRGSEGSGSGGPQDRGGGQTQGLHPVGLQICPFHCPSLLLPVSLHVP